MLGCMSEGQLGRAVMAGGVCVRGRGERRGRRYYYGSPDMIISWDFQDQVGSEVVGEVGLCNVPTLILQYLIKHLNVCNSKTFILRMYNNLAREILVHHNTNQ